VFSVVSPWWWHRGVCDLASAGDLVQGQAYSMVGAGSG
jgi:hypothetical protein